MIENEEERSKLLRLYEAKKEISDVLYRHKKLLSMLSDEEIKNRRCTVDDMLKFAHNITETSYATAGWRPGAPLINSHPPAPQVEQMRIGLLGALGVQLGLTSTQQEQEQMSLLRKASDTTDDGKEEVKDSIAMMIKEEIQQDKGKDDSVDVDMEIEVNATHEPTGGAAEDGTARPMVNQDRFARSAPVGFKKVIDMNMGFSDSDSDSDASNED